MTGPQRAGCLALVLVLGGIEWAGVRRAGSVYEDTNWQAATERSSASWRSWVRSRPVNLAVWRLVSNSVVVAHGVNVALHGLIALLVGVLAWRLGLSEAGAWIAGAVAWLHPLQSETVAYLSARAELLAALGIVAACVVSLGPWSWRRGVLLAGIGLVAMASKETAIVGGALVLLVQRRWRLALTTIGAIALLALWWSLRLGHSPGESWAWFTPMGRVQWAGWQIAASGRLLALLVWPDVLTVDHDYAWLSPWRGVIGLLLADVALYAWHIRDRWPVIAIGLLWPLLVILPRIGMLTSGSLLNEHQVYAAGPGFALLCGSLIGGRR